MPCQRTMLPVIVPLASSWFMVVPDGVLWGHELIFFGGLVVFNVLSFIGCDGGLHDF